MLSCDDILEIQNLLALYAYLIDDRRYSTVGEIFTEDAIYDVTAIGMEKFVGVAAMVEYWRNFGVPALLHGVTNMVIRENPDGAARVSSRCLVALEGGTVAVAMYEDLIRRTALGWRIAERVISTRATASIAAEC